MASSERRAAAYESIFGRPTGGGPSGPRPPRAYEAPQDDAYYPYAQYTQYQPYHPPLPPPPRSTYYVPPHPHHPHPAQPPPAPMYGPRPLAPPTAPRPHSVAGGYPPGIIAPRPLPEEAPDPAIDRLREQGLTPAQAYQAHVYRRELPPPPPAGFVLPMVEVTPEPPLSGPWDELEQRSYEDESRSETLHEQSPRQSLYQPSGAYSPPTPNRPQLMQLNTTLASQASASTSTTLVGENQLTYYPSSSTSPSPPISGAPVNLNPSASRRSIESVRTVPVGIGANGGSLGRAGRGHAYTGSIGTIPSDRSRSMSASASGPTPRPPVPRSNVPGSRRRPLVYPALLSRVADAFRQRITLSERTKDGLTYPNAFDGREAVDRIAYIIKTSDRNLALLLGRALDAQKFFHDVTYDHRLRDSPAEIYQFSGPRPSIGWPGEAAEDADGATPIRPGLLSPGGGSGSGSVATAAGAAVEEDADALPLPSGVFTLLTECYSPTCSRDRLCYCSACPRRLEQQRSLITRHQVTNQTTASPSPTTTIGNGSTVIRSGGKLPDSQSKESLIDHGVKEPGQLWVQSVPQEVVDSVSESERKRQEAINEVIYTERDFVRDLEYLRDSWMGPLRTEDVIPAERRTDFVQQVFWNIEDIIDVNTRLRDLLTKRQNAYPIVETIGDIFNELVPHFGPFV
ncbi:RHO1 GDP-GTP exchange protein 2, partial [Ceratobasidium sp. 392]